MLKRKVLIESQRLDRSLRLAPPFAMCNYYNWSERFWAPRKKYFLHLEISPPNEEANGTFATHTTLMPATRVQLPVVALLVTSFSVLGVVL